MDTSNNFLKFNTEAKAFLSRAVDHLNHYEEEGSVEFFYYAALEIRFGIEARLNEYLSQTLKSFGQDSKISDYSASKLLKKLTTIDPQASHKSLIQVTNEQRGQSIIWQYTPVTPRLASIHGQLGELLHYKFFTNNEHWYVRKPLGGNPQKSIADFLPLLREGIAELKQATSGTLLTNPHFSEIIKAEIDSIKEASDT